MGTRFCLDKVIAQTDIQYHDLPLRIYNRALVASLMYLGYKVGKEGGVLPWVDSRTFVIWT